MNLHIVTMSYLKVTLIAIKPIMGESITLPLKIDLSFIILHSEIRSDI